MGLAQPGPQIFCLWVKSASTEAASAARYLQLGEVEDFTKLEYKVVGGLFPTYITGVRSREVVIIHPNVLVGGLVLVPRDHFWGGALFFGCSPHFPFKHRVPV